MLDKVTEKTMNEFKQACDESSRKVKDALLELKGIKEESMKNIEERHKLLNAELEMVQQKIDANSTESAKFEKDLADIDAMLASMK